MKTDHMKKFLNEVLLYLWIPLIVGLVSYIFFELGDVFLGVIALVALSAMYTLVRLYFMHKKWWLLVILLVVILASIGVYFLKVPAYELTINDQKIIGTSLTLPEGTITINPAAQGNGQYSKNIVVTLTAEPASGHEWTGWTGTDNDTINPTTVTMDGDKQVQVNFKLRYALIINNQQVIGSYVSFAEGSVSISPAPSNVDGKYSHGTRVSLTVHPNAGYDWQSWTGTDNDYVNPTTVTMNGGQQITLTFSGRFELTINGQTVIGSTLLFDEGTVAVEPTPGSDGKFASGTTVTLTATPYTGYGWQSWSGTNNLASNPTTVTINGNKHITVNWDVRYLVSINGLPMFNASISFIGGTVSANPAPGINGSYAKNTRVTFTATPAEGYRFGWWGGEGSGTSNTVTIVFNGDKNISAIFIKTYNLIARASPTGGGMITPGSGSYDEGSTLMLTATAADGYRFDHWEGDASGNSPTVVVTMNTNRSVTAVFVKTYILTVTITPAGGGTVTTLNAVYDEGTVVTITATPAGGYVFTRWEGDASGTEATITITMTGNKAITAVFDVSP